MDLKKHYDKLWQNSAQQFKAGNFEYDSKIDAQRDSRYGITLITRPSKATIQAIMNILGRLVEAAPQQYAYPPADLHLTILSIISCYPGFKLTDIQPGQYTNIIRSVVNTADPFRIHFRGLTASPSAVLVQGFPEDNQLNQLRNLLRNRFNSSSLQHSIDKRYKLKTAHMTILRFKQPLQKKQTFLDRLSTLRNTDFGSCVINELALVANDWYQRQEKVQLIERFKL